MEDSSFDEGDKKRRLDDLDTSYGSDNRKIAQDAYSEEQASAKRATTEARGAQTASDAANNVLVGTNSQWIFTRNDDSQMVLSDNLGDAAAMVESLTHDMGNWSLTKQFSYTSKAKKDDKTYKRKCKTAKREIMRSMLKKE